MVAIMKNTDVVYILRNEIAKNANELTYSVRSLVENWTFRRLWFVGGNPKTIVPDGSIYHQQEGATRYERVRSSMERIAECDDISEQYFLFNDDFFILTKFEEWTPLFKGTIEDHADSLKAKYNGTSSYEKEIRFAGELLAKYGYPTKNYSLHVPYLVDKKKATETFKKFPSSAMFKNLYGNMHNIGGVEVDRDVKIHHLHENIKPGAKLVSTNETSFRFGYVGQEIRERFPNPCRYERGAK